MDIATMDLQARLEASITKAASLLPEDIGKQLLVLISPTSLATMAATVVLWAGSHFIGIGEIADIILLVVGWAAVGGVAVEAGSKLCDFATKTYNAHDEADLDDAASDLAQAITLIGINTVMALMLKKGPRDTFGTQLNKHKMPAYSSSLGRELAAVAPKNSHPGWRYRPKIRFTDKIEAGHGAADPWGDITIGRRYDRTVLSADEAAKKVLETIYHEKVHQFVAPKFYLLRELRAFINISAYQKSYILRYLEEFLAETIGLLRVRGLSKKYIIQGLKFPLKNEYQITFVALRHEAAGIFLGPIMVGGLIYNVYYGVHR
ncbi:hypothetical protein [Winslowiella iniecta]|uniref:Uncharacterized protein n=1 Tax=Winslowiella iniecta TaxID=1560201 RepID=A0A0L7SW51_9GAMM|nr:hypothetical protein [Winslowiella iniecta]KOC87362.1 hypothetical protein NG42_20810 [Winslowiella iniecta]KOC95097.1 hypothetical protein NG43_02575 [Winslowiella iniecta]